MNNWNGLLSLFIACIEIVLIINLIIFSSKNYLNKILIIIITLLAGYQSLEFLMCHFGLNYSALAYFAFSVISFLPPLNLFFIIKFYDIKIPYLKLIFLPAAVFIVYYYFVVDQFEVVSCTVLYASYNYPLGTLYGLFYYLPLIISLFIIIYKIKNIYDKNKIILSRLLITGHAIIMLPVVIAFVFAFYNLHGLLNIIESVMCKFAFIYALCLSIFCFYNGRIKNE